MSEKEPIMFEVRKKWHPKRGMVMKAKFIGYFKWYERWEFISDGLVIMGDVRQV